MIDGIIEAMTGESEVVAERHDRAVRASHAENTGLLKGELRVLDRLASRRARACSPRRAPTPCWSG